MGSEPQTKGRSFEWWMTSNFAAGAGFSAFVALLIPPYVTGLSSAADAGVVMAVISLGAVLGPALGGFADKYKAHRLVLTLGVLGMGLAFAMYAISAGSSSILVLDALVMGVAIAAQGSVAPVFVVAAGLSRSVQAKRLTTLSLTWPLGQVAGGILMVAAIKAGWDYPARFWMAAIIMLAAGVITWLGSAAAARRIESAPTKADGEGGNSARSSLRTIFASAFGTFLLVGILISVCNNGINSQIANILPNVYGIDAATTSGLMSLAGLINIPLFLVAGVWMARSGAMPVYTAAVLIRVVGALGLAVLGLWTNSPIILVAAAMQALYQGTPFARIAQPAVAVRFATIPAGAANGFVLGASAVGSFVGSLVGGYLAKNVGFNAINWMAVIAAAGAMTLIAVFLWPAERRKRDEEKKQVATTKAQPIEAEATP
ncbi:MAG TPA: MFS transporter [Thermoleophilia bacterium]|nr:MFS transporter [Thermoleophilia bacterium]